MRVKVRPATHADFMTLCGREPPYRCRAWAGEVDGRLVAIGGAAFGMHPTAAATVFLEGSEEARRFPVALHRAALTALISLRNAGLTTIAMVVDTCKPRSEAWARRLGFEPVDDSGVWIWRLSA